MSNTPETELHQWSSRWTMPELSWVGLSERCNLGISRAAMKAYGLEPTEPGIERPNLAHQLDEVNWHEGMPSAAIAIVAPHEKALATYAIHGEERKMTAVSVDLDPYTLRMVLGFNVHQDDKIELQEEYFSGLFGPVWEHCNMGDELREEGGFSTMATKLLIPTAVSGASRGLDLYHAGAGRDVSELSGSADQDAAYLQAIGSAVHRFLVPEVY